MRIVFLSSFVPRKCGIATYTRDLSDALVIQDQAISVVEMKNTDDVDKKHPYVSFNIRQEKRSDYKNIAQRINKSTVDIVHIQHEFGLFGGENGKYLLDFLRFLKKPIVVTFHTVLASPNPEQKVIIQELSRVSRAIIVMEEIAKDRLIQLYTINPGDITVIMHGVPAMDGISKQYARKKLQVQRSFILLASNLISRNKGFEYVIDALPVASEKIPNLKFFIVGETHPVVKKQEGESYRKELKKRVKKLGLEESVEFVNKYLTIQELRLYLAAADICVTPYLDPQQITSGTLSYAVGAGKACISTPFIHAQSMLNHKRGILVPFKNSKAIAGAIVKLYHDKKLLRSIEKRTHRYGEAMQWSGIAAKHIALYREIPKSWIDIGQTAKNFQGSLPKTDHLFSLTDHAGIMQHTMYAVPARQFGYSTDDNARALMAVADFKKYSRKKKYDDLLTVFISFLQHAQKNDGRFHTFLTFQHTWNDHATVSDAYGRSMLALGYTLYLQTAGKYNRSLDLMFRRSLHRADSITDLRSASNTILGLYYYILAFDSERESTFVAHQMLELLAVQLLDAYEKHADGSWQWFEQTLTYDNFRLPLALFAAHLISEKERYKEIALKTLVFVTEHNFDKEHLYFDFVGQNKWMERNKEKAYFDQQPLEVYGAVEAHVFAYKATKNPRYIRLANIAFQWFFGRNRNYRSMISQETHGVFDGLTPSGVNENQGAESILSLLLSWFCLRQISE